MIFDRTPMYLWRLRSDTRPIPLSIATVLTMLLAALFCLASYAFESQCAADCQQTLESTQLNDDRLSPQSVVTKSTPNAQKKSTQREEETLAKQSVINTSHNAPGYFLDWVPYHLLSDEQKVVEPFYSCGAYIAPISWASEYVDLKVAPILAESYELSYDQNARATLSGNVIVKHGRRQFESDNAYLDKMRNYGLFEGHVRFRDNNVLLVGDKADIYLDSGQAMVENTVYVVHDIKARGSASRIVRNEDSTLSLKDATYTTCPPNDNNWILSAQNVNLDTNSGFGQAKNSVLKIHGFPIFYVPYLSFPMDDRRKSGFLYPRFSIRSDNGFSVSVPYYLNIAPNYDATFTTRYMSNRGVMMENEFRYLLENSEGELGISGLLGKDELKKENSNYNQERWLIHFQQKVQHNSQWVSEIDYSKASDKNYLDDFSTGFNMATNTTLNQQISSNYLGGNTDLQWQFGLKAQKYQNMSHTADAPFNKMPQITVSGHWQVNTHLSVNYVSDYTKFNREENWHYVSRSLVNPTDNVYQSRYDAGFGLKRANGERLYLETGATYLLDSNYGFVRPSVKLQHSQYWLSNLHRQDVVADLNRAYGHFTEADYTESPATTVPTLSIDSAAYFDRETTINGTPFMHTIEPRIKYLYSPYVKGQEMHQIFDSSLMSFNYDSLWRDSRFAGYDRLGDANRIAYGVSTQLIEHDGFERFNLGIGQLFYFTDRRLWISPDVGKDPGIVIQNDIDTSDEAARLRANMQTSVSPLVSRLVYNFDRKTHIVQDLMWDSSAHEMDSYGIYYRYHSNDRRILNAGYRYLRRADRYVKNEQNEKISDPNRPGAYLTTANNLRQTDLSIAWPVSKHWTTVGRWQYDLTNNRNLEILSGIEYNNCCSQIRFLWRRWVDNENIDYPDSKNGIFFQVVLRGLGDFGSGSIKGYLDGVSGYTGG